MLPASDLTEILVNLSALNLQPNTAAAVLGAVLVPLLRSPQTATPAPVVRPRAKPRPAPQRKQLKRRRRASRPMQARERARAALQANPGKSLTAVAKLAGVSRSTVVTASGELAAAARKQARREARKQREAMPSTVPAKAGIGGSTTAKPTERRQRAQRFLRDALAGGPQKVTDVEAAAAKARIDVQALEQARADLHIVVSRANAGATPHAVQWSLPG